MDDNTARPTFHTGALLDERYELRRLLGEGSEGRVFEAVHQFTGQRHAVKVALSPLGDKRRARMLREASALGRLRHPNVVSITDAGVSEGFPFVAMELLEGRSIEGLLAARGSLSVANVLSAAAQVCDALTAAHAVGVLHRDVKPSNVIVIEEAHGECVKLIDFGTSKDTSPASERMTAPGTLVGTPAYMAPEQLLAHEVDVRVDVYAVGVLIFECLTGIVPYEGPYPNVLMAVCNLNPPPSIRLVRPQIDSAIDRIVTRALAKRPEDRYASTAELAAALRSLQPQIERTHLLEPPVGVPATRRKFNRAAYRTPVSVSTSSGEIHGRCDDISEGGMLFLAERSCPLDEEVSVRFAAPIEGRISTCTARVSWVRRRPEPRLATAVGLEFTAVPSELRATLARYVALMTGEVQYMEHVTESIPPLAMMKRTLPDTPRAILDVELSRGTSRDE